MKNILGKINAIESDELSGWSQDAKWRNENRDWLNKSIQIAIKILREIRRQKPINGMSQKALAEAIGVTPQYINKVVKGQENLTLITISKIESVLGISLIHIPVNSNTQSIASHVTSLIPIDRNNAKSIGSIKVFLKEDTGFSTEIFDGSQADGTYGY